MDVGDEGAEWAEGEKVAEGAEGANEMYYFITFNFPHLQAWFGWQWAKYTYKF